MKIKALLQAIRESVDKLERTQLEAREVALINRYAADLNAEMVDVLSLQAEVMELDAAVAEQLKRDAHEIPR
jgi:hypothetical protein